MKICKVFILLLLTSLVSVNPKISSAEDKAAPASAEQTQISFEESGWEHRCQIDPETKKENKDRCEIYKVLKVKGSQGKVAEFAVGRNIKDKNVFNGVVIAPLGVLLEEGILLKIDDGKPVMFKPRFCAQIGCVSYITLDTALLDTMKKGNKISFIFRSYNGQKVNIDMQLSGFTKAVKGI